jgi:hypothetical protein
LSKKITLQLFFITLNAEKAEAKKEKKKKKTSLGISLMMHFQSSDGGYLLK